MLDQVERCTYLSRVWAGEVPYSNPAIGHVGRKQIRVRAEVVGVVGQVDERPDALTEQCVQLVVRDSNVKVALI